MEELDVTIDERIDATATIAADLGERTVTTSAAFDAASFEDRGDTHIDAAADDAEDTQYDVVPPPRAQGSAPTRAPGPLPQIPQLPGPKHGGRR